jgi:hypothetical protein
MLQLHKTKFSLEGLSAILGIIVCKYVPFPYIWGHLGTNLVPLKLKPRTAKRLAPYSNGIKFTADRRNPIAKRRACIVQKGIFTVSAHNSVGPASQFSIMEHVRRLVLVPEHMAEQRKKPLVPPLTAQVSEIDSDMHTLLERQDIPVDKQAKLYDQSLQRYLNFYDKRMNKPVKVSVAQPPTTEEKRRGRSKKGRRKKG